MSFMVDKRKEANYTREEYGKKLPFNFFQEFI